MNNKAEFNFSISGFILALLVISMISTGFGIFLTDIESNYNISGNFTLSEYESFSALYNNTQDIRDATEFTQETGLFDVIGSFFSSGISAIKTSLASFSLFEDMMNQAGKDIGFVSQFKIKDYLSMFILIGIFLGVIIAALLKWRT